MNDDHPLERLLAISDLLPILKAIEAEEHAERVERCRQASVREAEARLRHPSNGGCVLSPEDRDTADALLRRALGES